MKKIFAMLLSVMMIAAMSLTTFAAELPANATDDATSKDVTASYVAGTSADAVYLVDIAWGSLEFTYTSASEGTWNPESHTYDDAAEASWTCADGANKIVVTNHSNAAVAVEIANSNVMDGVSLIWSNNSLELATADNGQGENGTGVPTTASALLTVEGAIAETTNKVTLGTVTITLKTN